MANPTANIQFAYEVKGTERYEFPVKDATTLYINESVAFDPATGRVAPPTDSLTEIPAGFVSHASDGDNASILGDTAGNQKVQVYGGVERKSVDIVGVAAITDVGKYVYFTDGQLMTLTAGNKSPAGVITKWHSGTTCNVYYFNFPMAKTLR